MTLIERDVRLAHATTVGYFLIVVVHAFLLAAFAACPLDDLTLLYCVASLATAIAIFAVTHRSTGAAAMTPLTLFASIWLVLVPLASFEAPLMRRANSDEIWTCLVAGLVFSLGGLVATLGNGSFFQSPMEHSPTARPPEKLAGVAALLLCISIVALLVNTALEGGFALLRESGTERKAQSSFFAYPLLSSLGTISLVILARLRRVTAPQVIASVVYLVLQLLTGQRFVAIVGLVLTMVALGSSHTSTGISKRRIAIVAIGVVAAFMFVANFRGGGSDQRQYFLDTGLYSGNPELLSATEFVRYVGMSQRNMSVVIARPFNSSQLLEHTLSPISSLFGDPLGGLGTSTHGYTANNAIAYMHHDAGNWWPLLVLLWAIGINQIYWLSRRRRDSIALGFMWCVSALGLTLSFFAYVSSYVYWVALFPMIVFIIDRTKTRMAADRTPAKRPRADLNWRRGHGRVI